MHKLQSQKLFGISLGRIVWNADDTTWNTSMLQLISKFSKRDACF